MLFFKQLLCPVKLFVQVFSHALELGTLSGKYICLHMMEFNYFNYLCASLDNAKLVIFAFFSSAHTIYVLSARLEIKRN